MKIIKGREHVIIQDDLGHPLLLGNEQIPELISELSNYPLVFKGIDLSKFISTAMSISAMFNNLWVIDTLSIDNNVSNTSCSAGRCIVSCVLYKKETGKKYHGVFLKENQSETYTLELIEEI